MASSEQKVGTLPMLIASFASCLSPFALSVPERRKLDQPETSLLHRHSNYDTLPVRTVLPPNQQHPVFSPEISIANTYDNHLAYLTNN